MANKCFHCRGSTVGEWAFGLQCLRMECSLLMDDQGGPFLPVACTRCGCDAITWDAERLYYDCPGCTRSRCGPFPSEARSGLFRATIPPAIDPYRPDLGYRPPIAARNRVDSPAPAGMTTTATSSTA